MSKTNYMTSRFTLSISLLVGLSALAGGCKEEDMLCTAARGTFAVKYTLVSGTGACAELKGARVGVQSYLNPDKPSTPNYDMTLVAIKPEAVGRLVTQYKQNPDPTKIYSLGRFTEERAGDDGYCEVADPTATELKLNAVPATMDAMGMPVAALPAVDVRYQWSKLRFWVNPASPGTQFSAELAYTRDGCTATYTVQGITPAASCAKLDDEGSPTTMPDQERCSSCADPLAGRPSSHIDPTVETVCEPTSLLCLPATTIPSPRVPEVCPTLTAGEPWPEAGPKEVPVDSAPPPVDAAVEAPADTGGSDAGAADAPASDAGDAAAG